MEVTPGSGGRVPLPAEHDENDQQAGFHVDPVAGVRSIRRIKRLVRRHGAELFFTHDMESFRTYKLAPDHYGG